MKSMKPVLPLEKISLPYKITFPETVNGGVNEVWFQYPRNIEVFITFQIYEAILNSQYGDYLKD